MSIAAQIAAALGTTEQQIRALADRPPYRRWRVAKRAGGLRELAEPMPRLKAAQRWLLRQVLDRLPVHEAAHGSRAGRSIVTFAAPHAGAGILLKADLRDFFGTITAPRVRGLLLGLGHPHDDASTIAMLCTAELGRTRSLPQGAPTSPAIANAIAYRLDQWCTALARQHGGHYTRYVDDLAISFGLDQPANQILEDMIAIVRREGFRLHYGKTRLEPSHQRQEVAGLVVNASPRPRREMLRRLRAAVDQAGRATPQEVEHLRGMIGYVTMCSPKLGERLAHMLEERTAPR